MKLMRGAQAAMESAFEAEFVSLHVRAYSNRAAFSLYTSTLGFEVKDTEAKYYADAEDAYYMQKMLAPGKAKQAEKEKKAEEKKLALESKKAEKSQVEVKKEEAKEEKKDEAEEADKDAKEETMTMRKKEGTELARPARKRRRRVARRRVSVSGVAHTAIPESVNTLCLTSLR